MKKKDILVRHFYFHWFWSFIKKNCECRKCFFLFTGNWFFVGQWKLTFYAKTLLYFLVFIESCKTFIFYFLLRIFIQSFFIYFWWKRFFYRNLFSLVAKTVSIFSWKLPNLYSYFIHWILFHLFFHYLRNWFTFTSLDFINYPFCDKKLVKCNYSI